MLIFAVIVVWQSVVRQWMGIFLIIELSALLQPSYSIALDDVVSHLSNAKFHYQACFLIHEGICAIFS